MNDAINPVVCIVEDDFSTATLIKQTLEKKGFRTMCLNTGKEMLSLLPGQKEMILIIDYHLDDGKSIHFLKRLKEDGYSFPFIVMTGAGNEEIAIEALREGAEDYIVKNIGFNEILPALLERILLKRHAANKEAMTARFSELIFNEVSDPIFVLENKDGYKIVKWNNAASDAFGWLVEDVVEKSIFQFCKGATELESLLSTCNGSGHMFQTLIKCKDGKETMVDIRIVKQHDSDKTVHSYLVVCNNVRISESADAKLQAEPLAKESGLNPGIMEANSHEVRTLLNVLSKIFEVNDFEKSAAVVHKAAKELIGAKAGYIALLSETGDENEVVYLDPGPYDCKVDLSLPMPIRGLRAEAYHSNQVVIDNNFSQSKHMQYMPDGHVELNNVLFAPLIIDGKAKGLMGMSNKEGGFTEKDKETAANFAKFASISLHNSMLMSTLSIGEAKYRQITENAMDVIWTMGFDGRFLYVSPSIFRLRGYTAEEVMEQNLSEVLTQQSLAFVMKELAITTAEILEEQRPEPRKFVLEQLHKNGAIIITESTIGAVYNEQGKFMFFLGVSRDITEMKKSEKQIELLNQMLTAKNDELEKLVYITSHDFRSPMVNIDGFCKELEKQFKRIEEAIDADDEDLLKGQILQIIKNKVPQYFKFIYASTGKMDSLIKGMLQLSRIGRTQPNFERLNMNKLVGEVISTFEYSLSKYNIEVIVTDLHECKGDSSLLNQVISNLVDNAIKYRKADITCQILISSIVEDDFIVYSFEDNGIGVDPEKSAAVFDLFYQENKAIKGEGLGLAHVKKIVELHKGRIKIESEKGKGTTFLVMLPMNL